MGCLFQYIEIDFAGGEDFSGNFRLRGIMREIKKPELLVPAGGIETLRTAVLYGADAVYMGGDAYGLRANAKNFSNDDMKKAIEFCHERGVKVYITANIYAHNYDLDGIKNYFTELNNEIKPDAVLISDPGVISIAKEYMPDIDIHISTQANTTNFMSVLFWVKQGAKRIVTARELSLKEIKEIRENIPDDIEIECFVHGAMCISYSGRCLLSNYFTGRDANRGECTHPCRWKYTVLEKSDKAADDSEENVNGKCSGYANDENIVSENYDFKNPTHKVDSMKEFYLEEDERPGEYLPVFENERGTYIMNSKDLCMIDHIPELIDAGIDSLKIEGRMKNPLYVATVARTYRMAIDAYFRSEDEYKEMLPWLNEQIASCTYRKFTTGFYFGKPGSDEQIYDNNTYVNAYTLIGIVEEILDDGRVRFYQKNKFSVGETIEIMKPDGRNIETKVLSIKDSEGHEMESAPHPLQILFVSFDTLPEKYDILRRSETK